MSLSRCLNIGGPAKIVTAAGTFVTTGDIKVTINRELRDLESALAGKIGKLLTKTKITISAELAPKPIYATQLIALQPTDIGSSIFGCTDAYLEIHGRDDTKLRFHAAGLSKPPPVRFSSSRNLYGEAEWSCVVKNEEDLGTLGKLLTVSTASFTEPADAANAAGWVNKAGKLYFDTSEMDIGVNPFAGISSEDGIEVAVDYETQDRSDDLNGWYDTKLSGVSVSVKFKPTNLDLADLMTLLPVDGPSAVPGLNLATIGKDLLIQHEPQANGDLICTIPLAAADASSLIWSRNQNRIGEVTFMGLMSVDGSSVPNPLYGFTRYSA